MNNKKYKVINETFYKKNTPLEVIKLLEWSRETKTRILLDYGDVKTGKSWGENYDIRGYIGRSTGSIKIPLLIQISRSLGGSGVLDDSIIKISLSKGGKVLYKLN